LNSTAVVEENFDYLDAPVERRITGGDVPLACTANLGRLVVPQVSILPNPFRTRYNTIKS